MAIRYFLDTNVLLDDFEKYISLPFMISSETLKELEIIKTNRNKIEDIRCAARHATRWLSENYNSYDVIVYNKDVEDIIIASKLDPSSIDARICCCAKYYNNINPEEKLIFVTHDLSCRNIADKILNLNVEWDNDEKINDYKGFIEISPDDNELAYFYEHQEENMYELLTNQYLIIKNDSGEVIDSYRWDGNSYNAIYKKPLKSTYFDKLKPKDIYQSLMIDSIMNNTITAVSAKPGAGKSLISLLASMSLIENGKYDRLVILYNPTKARGAVDQGYYTGNAIEKGLQQSVGQMLATKFGDQFGVELLIQQGKLKLVSLADCRGMEIRDNEILYLTESQNTTSDLIKLALSRVSSGAKVIIEGDDKTQVDLNIFEGRNNGLRRVIDVFKGHEEFGYIELQNIWRSKLAQLAELL